MPDVRCLKCKGRIGWLQRRRGSSFCSPRHESDYHDRQLALDRLAGRVRGSFGETVAPVLAPSTPKLITVIVREWRREVLEGVHLMTSRIFTGRPRKWAHWLPGAAAGVVLVALAVTSGRPLSPERNAPEWVVVNLPDPPGYQESLPERPEMAALAFASAEGAAADN